ncbi:MAG TPA: ABC transporter substrate-binding protein [Candidatus Avacidaminococcus intestinavium]|uniref:ABC transporter substrate-binding protein n=1 Tax=Candidatus Avacidaminococcus intestinavium TaxID=2840684 RepID=A0A9D1MPN1_9FIRM|nr:ABC transporter substrate-binding protein [Candidatus Avacidaminococcus intestinavium]
MTSWKKLFCTVCVAALATTVLVGCGGGAKKNAAEADEIVIGASFELTGGVANYGKSTLSGVKMAVDEYNKAGGINGKKIRLVESDNKSEPSEAGNSVTKLINQDHAVAIIGPATSGCVAASSQIATDAKIPLMAPVATAENITVKDGKTKDFIFRACFIDPFQGQVMAEFANKTLKVKNVAILYDASSEYSKGLTAVFTENLEKNGGKVVASEAFLAKDVDFKAALTKIKATNPEAIYIPAYYEEVAKIIKQAREVGLDCPLIGSDGWDSPKLAEIAGAAALDRTYFCSAYSAQDQEPSVQAFIKNYKAMFNAEPDNFAIHGYDAAIIVLEAIKRGGTTDGTLLAAEMAKTKDLQVATGKVSYDEKHNPIASAVVIELKDGVQTFKEKISL